MNAANHRKSAWSWVPSLYFAEGIPYIVVMQVAVLMYKRLGVSNTELALYTSWLYLPWVIKPLWSPIVETIRTKRFWIIAMQLVIGAGLAGVLVLGLTACASSSRDAGTTTAASGSAPRGLPGTTAPRCARP